MVTVSSVINFVPSLSVHITIAEFYLMIGYIKMNTLITEYI